MIKINSKEDLRLAKKELTSLQNSLTKKAKKVFEKSGIADVAKKARENFDFGDKSSLSLAVWSLYSFHPYCASILSLKESCDLLKDAGYAELSKMGEKLYNELKNDALIVKKHEEDLQEATRKYEKSPFFFIERVQSSKNTPDDKKKAFFNFINDLKNWEEPRIENKSIIVNGKNIGTGGFVGVMIGKGHRIHLMEAFIAKNKSGEDAIGLKNYTQWYRSALVIIDTVENIPSELLAD